MSVKMLCLPSDQLDVAANELPRVARAIAEGPDPSVNLPGLAIADILTRNVLYILSVMNQPDPRHDHTRLGRDTDLQHTHHGLLAAGRRGWTADMSVYPELQHRSLEPERLIHDVLASSSLAGYAVSWMLRWVVRQHAGGQRPRAAGQGAAFNEFSLHCQQHDKTGGSVVHLKENIWPRFAPVAHLWAAYYTLADVRKILQDPAAFMFFLGTAAAYLERGCEIHPKQSRGPFLDRRVAWIVPENCIDRAPDGRIMNSLELG